MSVFEKNFKTKNLGDQSRRRIEWFEKCYFDRKLTILIENEVKYETFSI